MDKNNQAAPQDDAAAFISVERPVPFNGQTIVVKPLDVLQVIRVSRALKAVLPALDTLPALLSALPDETDPAAEFSAEAVSQIVTLLADYGEPLTEGIAIAIDKPVEFVRHANDFAGLFGLIAAVVRVNVDFFAQQAGPRLAGLKDALSGSGDGAMPSTPSSAPGTAH